MSNSSDIAADRELRTLLGMKTAKQLMADRLRHAREKKGFETAKEFAEKHGIPQPTYAMHEKGTRGLQREVVKRYAGLLGINEVWLLTGEGPFEGGDDLDRIYVVGKVEAGAWVEAMQWAEHDWYSVEPPKDVRYQTLKKFALEVHGDSMNAVYHAGDVLVCVLVGDLGYEIRPGQRVIVSRPNPTGEGIEATCKELTVDKNGNYWLWPRSHSPEHQQPIAFNQEARGLGVEVIALVIGSYRQEIWD